MTEQEYRLSDLRGQLEQLLFQPALIEALNVIEERPDGYPVGAQHVHTDLLLARTYMEVVGTNKAVKKLKRLAEAWPQTPEGESLAEREQWGDHRETLESFPESVRAQIKDYFEKKTSSNPNP